MDGHARPARCRAFPAIGCRAGAARIQRAAVYHGAPISRKAGNTRSSRRCPAGRRAPLFRGAIDYRTMSQPVGLNFDPFGSFLNVELVMRVVGPSSMMAVTVK